VLTDPPYTERTHEKARKNTQDGIGEGITEFASITDDELRTVLAECGRVTRGWVVATLDYNHAFAFESEPPAGLRQLRIGVWMKTNPTPQISGDRPAQGWEAISYMHTTAVGPKWNGGGKHGNYITKIATANGHPTAKPLPIVEAWVAQFTNPGDMILDPFAGSGTTLRAASNLGRRAIGVELDESYCDLIVSRLGQQAFDFEAIA